MSDKISAKDLEELKEKLSSKRWRLTSGKFYKIKDKDGNIIPFIPNKFQLYYFKNKHNRNIILKARQMWFSTAIQLDFLDDALFNRNFSVGIIAQDKDTASLIRKDKIEVALENLPDLVKDYRKYDKQNQKEITFSNGSSIYVSNSFRWGTLQRLHISEYGKICSKYPEKAEEIRTWAIEAVKMDQQITIESTAEWNDWDFFRKCEEFSKLVNKPITPLDYKFFFFPRWIEDQYAYEWVVVTIPQEYEDYFKKLHDEFGIELSEWQKNRYYLKRKDLQDKMLREYPSYYDEAFMVALEWAYLQSEINTLYQQNRFTRVLYDPNLRVYTVWDIWWAGWWDDTSVRFFQIYWREVRWIDYWDWSWYGMLWVFENIINQKPYKYQAHIWPHDLKVHSQVTWQSRLETLKQHWYYMEFVESPPWAVSARIDMMRLILPNSFIDSKNCSAWLDKLKSYKRKRNASTWSWTDMVEKNGSQHAADAFWYWCQYIIDNLLPRLKREEDDIWSIQTHIQLKQSITR